MATPWQCRSPRQRWDSAMRERRAPSPTRISAVLPSTAPSTAPQEYILNASGCSPRGCSGSFVATLGSREVRPTLEQSLSSGGSASRTCASVMPGWGGVFDLQCYYGAVVGDGSGCAPGTCDAGQMATVVVGGTVAEVAILAAMQSFANLTQSCSSVDASYEGQFSITCEASVLLTDTSACLPIAVAGATTQARKVVRSAVAFALPELNATLSEMQAQMETTASKRAYALTLAATLGASDQDIAVLSILVYDATARRRLDSRFLAAVNKMEVSVNFQVTTKTDQASEVESLVSKVASLGDTNSAEQQTFASALGTNLEAAAKANPESLALLSLTAKAVISDGVQVRHTETPQVSTTYVSVEEPNKDSGSVIVSVFAAVFGILAACLCPLCIYWAVKNWQPATA
ncbi:unnamed protein product, partial [Effrenium voratum]